MKQISVKYGNKQIVITKDILTISIGIIILIIDAMLVGFLQLFESGFDWSYIKKTEFWSAYFIKLAISYIALFGAYIIRRTVAKKNPKIILLREKLKDCKNTIVKGRKINNCKNWLKYVYNYRKKVEIYQDLITEKYEKLVLVEPEEPDFENINKCLKKSKLKKKYQKELKVYNKNEKLRKFYEEQLNVCDIHFQIIDNYKKHNIEKVVELQDKIKNIDFMKNYKLNYKNITYNKLFNVDLTSNQKDDLIEYSEFKELLSQIIPAIFTGIITCALLTSVVVQQKSITTETILMIVLNLLMMIWFMFTGIRIADTFVFGTVYVADNNRLMICEEFLEDSQINGDNWIQEIENLENK